MTGTRQRIVNTVFSNRGSIANAAAAVREGNSRAKDRVSAARAVAVADARFAASERHSQGSWQNPSG